MNRAAPDALLVALLELWATLRAAHHTYWTLHWRSRGASYYGDHLLYQRLYEARVKEIDRMAETIAALYGSDHLAALTAWDAAQRVLVTVSNSPDPGLRVAELTLHAANRANAAIGSHPYGVAVNNVIAGIADAALESVYLLQQRSR
jgi:DNA-binding ferritin-like protein